MPLTTEDLADNRTAEKIKADNAAKEAQDKIDADLAKAKAAADAAAAPKPAAKEKANPDPNKDTNPAVMPKEPTIEELKARDAAVAKAKAEAAAAEEKRVKAERDARDKILKTKTPEVYPPRVRDASTPATGTEGTRISQPSLEPCQSCANFKQGYTNARTCLHTD